MKFTFVRFAGIVALCAFVAYVFYKYRQPRFVAGEAAPAFEVVLMNGKHTQLADFQGKYLLLQFWGSWCGPCRKENPHLAELYQKYHAQGFEILSVGIEQNPKAWQRAIQQDGLAWDYHTMESQDFNGPLARQFNIHSIPTTFLINPEGRIMGMNLPPKELGKTLARYLALR